jgi:hypothetical protein
MKILPLLLISILSLFGTTLLFDSSFTEWDVKNEKTNKDSISWAKFKWTNEEINGRYFEKVSMFIPCKVDGVPNIVTFQFDLGADLTCIYEKNYSSFYRKNPKLSENIKKETFRTKKYFENIKIQFGDYTATTKTSLILADYGEFVENFTKADTIHIGSICADIFKNRVLIIDYPNKQFAICNQIPNLFSNITLTDITLDKKNRPLLQMTIQNRKYKVLFDNGSSMFPLITNKKNISDFSSTTDTDTIQTSSWGKIHNVTGKPIEEPFTLGGQNFNSTMIYVDHRKQQNKNEWDLIAGNALFWDKTIIIDFKNKKFGVK